MKNKVYYALFITVFLFCFCSLSGCFYSNVRIPLDKDVSETSLGTKTGKASIHVAAWLFAWGDCGTAAAAKNGDIETITHLDSEVLMILFGLYSKKTTIAYGE